MLEPWRDVSLTIQQRIEPLCSFYRSQNSLFVRFSWYSICCKILPSNTHFRYEGSRNFLLENEFFVKNKLCRIYCVWSFLDFYWRSMPRIPHLLSHLRAMDSSDPFLVRHLLTFWRPAWRQITFLTCVWNKSESVNTVDLPCDWTWNWNLILAFKYSSHFMIMLYTNMI